MSQRQKLDTSDKRHLVAFQLISIFDIQWVVFLPYRNTSYTESWPFLQNPSFTKYKTTFTIFDQIQNIWPYLKYRRIQNFRDHDNYTKFTIWGHRSQLEILVPFVPTLRVESKVNTLQVWWTTSLCPVTKYV